MILPIGAGVIAVVVGGAVIYYLFIRKEKKTELKALEDPNVKYPLRLVDREEVNHNTIRLTFGLPSSEHVLGLPVGQHVYVSAQINGSLVIRPYTPVSSDRQKGYVQLVVKVYRKNENPRFPEGGKMSQHLDALEIGDFIDFRGPSGLLVYNGKGEFAIKKDKKSPAELKQVKRLGMIAGGTGITPMYQLALEVLEGECYEGLQMHLLFANQSEDDILIRDELEKLRDSYPNQFKLWYTVDKSTDGWSYSTGFVDDKMIDEHLPKAGAETLVLMCGPPPMIDRACLPNLTKLGFTDEMIFKY